MRADDWNLARGEEVPEADVHLCVLHRRTQLNGAGFTVGRAFGKVGCGSWAYTGAEGLHATPMAVCVLSVCYGSVRTMPSAPAGAAAAVSGCPIVTREHSVRQIRQHRAPPKAFSCRPAAPSTGPVYCALTAGAIARVYHARFWEGHPKTEDPTHLPTLSVGFCSPSVSVQMRTAQQAGLQTNRKEVGDALLPILGRGWFGVVLASFPCVPQHLSP